MKQINCLVVDDELASREIMENYIYNFPSLNCVCLCKNAFEASEAMRKLDIKIVFLDINMPGLSGMKFYKSLERPPLVIFTTAYPEFAVEGFEVGAVDYLLKPFPFERFVKAVNKAIKSICTTEIKMGTDEYILLKSDKRINKVLINSIRYIEAVGDYVKVCYDGKSIVVHSTFQNLLKQLPESLILRVHKSYAVSLAFIEAIEGNLVILSSRKIPIGQSYKSNFMKSMHMK